LIALVYLLLLPVSMSAEVTSVTITSRMIVAGGKSFGSTGPYGRLIGRIEFALDPADPHNIGIVDLNHARRDSDGRVHFFVVLDGDVMQDFSALHRTVAVLKAGRIVHGALPDP
jgi:hypothetical protein